MPRVLILGGGLASLTTALELTRPGVNAGKFDITVYQIGWRLGGKCASGRNPDQHERIEEHGLHVWLGFYENAFRLMREVMAEWQLPTNHPWHTADPRLRWRQAFKPHDDCPLAEWRQGRWELWPLRFPRRNNGTPGDGQNPVQDLPRYIAALADALLKMLTNGAPWLGLDEGVPALLAAGVLDPKAAGRLVSETVSLLATTMFRPAGPPADVCRNLATMANDVLVDSSNSAARRLGILLNLGWALVNGLVNHAPDILAHSLDVLDDQDLRQFLKDHGASSQTVQCPLVAALYDSLFAFEGGDPGRERLAAGAAVRVLLRIFFGYKETLSWKMQAGMGDTVLTPFYRVLEARGVRFKFFHEVVSLAPTEDGRRVGAVTMRRQLDLRDGVAAYNPLVSIKSLECWPSQPRWDQIDPQDVDTIQRGQHDLEKPNSGLRGKGDETLRAGEHFDHVVLGIPIGALAELAPRLLEASPPLAAMTQKVRTVQTQAFQVWLRKDLAGLGWQGKPPVLCNYLDPLNTWADMTHLLPLENAPADVRNLGYFCGPLPEGHGPSQVRAAANRLLDELARSFWPGANANGRFDPALVSMDYVRANTNPSDRYVLSLPGSTRFRLRANESGFENLTLAGDWTRNGLNVGCVEAAVVSGMLASQAISGWPSAAEIAGVNGL